MIIIRERKWVINDIAQMMGKSSLTKGHSYYTSNLRLNLKIDTDWVKYMLDSFYDSPLYKLTKGDQVKLAKEAEKFPVKMIPLKDIVSEQTWFDPFILLDNLNKPSSLPIATMLSKGKYLLLDGNHRVISAIMNKKSTIKSYVLTY